MFCLSALIFSQTYEKIEKWENLQPGCHYDYKTYVNKLINNSDFLQTEFYGSKYSFFQKKEHEEYKYSLYEKNMLRVLVTNAETWNGADIVCTDIYPSDIEENFFRGTSNDIIFFGYTSDGTKCLYDDFTSKKYGVYHVSLLTKIDMPKIKYGLFLEEDDKTKKIFYFLSHDNILYALDLTTYELNEIFHFNEDVEFYSVIYGEASKGIEGTVFDYNKICVYKSHHGKYDNSLIYTDIFSFPISYILSPSTIETPSTPDQTWYVLENNQITIKTDIPKYTFK